MGCEMGTLRDPLASFQCPADSLPTTFPIIALAFCAQDGADLRAHMRAEHFLCEEADCAGCFTAYATEEELRKHCIDKHSK